MAPLVSPFFPAPAAWHWRFLGSEGEAQDFLSTTWQVQAAAVALSLAVAVFAVQAVAADRWRPTPREIARATQADAVLSLGVASILITGVAVAGLGHGGANGWSGSVAATFAALSLFSVLPLWVTSVSAVAGGKLRTIRLGEITRGVEASVDRAVHERIALRILTAFLDSSGAEFSMLDLGSGSGSPVAAGRGGYVSDINLRRLGRVLDHNAAKVRVRGYLGLACSAESVLARVADDPKVSRRVRGAFKVRQSRQDDVAVGFSFLHHLATQALRDGDALAYGEVHSAYRSSLKIYPEAWSRFGRRFDSDASQQLNPFGLPVLSEVQRNLIRQINTAADGPNTELVADAVALPGLVALDAAKLGADALFTSMLDVMAAAHWQLLGRGVPSTIDRRLRDVLLHSIEYGPVATVTSADETIARRLQAAELVQLGYKRIASLAKQLLDLDKAEELARLLKDWYRPLRFFAPGEQLATNRWRLELSQQQGHFDPDLEVALAELESLVTIQRALVDARDSLLLQLLGWAVHRVRVDGSSPSAAAQRILAAVPGNLDRLLELAQFDRFDSTLGHWIIFDRADDSNGGGVDSFAPLLDAIALAVIRSAEVKQPPVFDATVRVADFEDSLVRHVDQMAHLWTWDSIAPRGDQLDKALVVSDAIRDAAERYRLQRELDVVRKPLDPVRVSKFLNQVSETFLATRVVPRWLGGEATPVPRDDSKRLTVMGNDETLSREWLQDDAKIDISSIAEESGRLMAQSEVSMAIRQLDSVAPVEHQGDVLSAAMEGIQVVRATGADPNAVFVPRHQQNWRVFALARRDRPFNTARMPDAHPPFSIVDGVEVFESELLAPDRVIVADLRKALSWMPTTVQPEGEELVIDIRSGPSIEDAQRQAEADPTYGMQTDGEDADARARRIAGTVKLYARFCAYVAIGDATSVVAFTVVKPPSPSSPTPTSVVELTKHLTGN